MNLIRQETDYALRLITELGCQADLGSLSAKVLAQRADVPYEFACKILQKLHEGKLVKSVMGPKGGFKLARPANQITLLEVISIVQGPMSLNTCGGETGCTRQENCPLTDKMQELQDQIQMFFAGITMEDVLHGKLTAKETTDAA